MESKTHRLIPLSVAVLLFIVPHLAWAQVVFTEIMYDVDGTDTGHEWIEVQNIGNDPVDLSAWKLFEANTNHKIISVGNPNITPGNYAILADVPEKFLADHPGFSGALFDSAFSLSNDGETIVLKNPDAGDSDVVSYVPAWGAVGDGNSLQKVSGGAWITTQPTPGSVTLATQSTEPLNTESNSGDNPTASSTDISSNNQTTNGSQLQITHSYSSHSGQSVANLSYDEPELVVTSGRPRLGFTGVPLSFEAKVKSAKNIAVGNAPHSTWSMGDGTELRGQFVSHAYDFPGEYVVILNSELGGAAAVSKVKVKILDPKVSIPEANSEYVAISNQDDYELNIGKWILETDNKRFIIPQDTIIPAHSIVKLSALSTKLETSGDFVRIANPSGKILSSLDTKYTSTDQTNPVVTVSRDLSVEEIKSRYLTALRIEMDENSNLSTINTGDNFSAQKKDTSEITNTSSTTSAQTMTASVANTVPNNREKSWFDLLMRVFKK